MQGMPLTGGAEPLRAGRPPNSIDHWVMTAFKCQDSCISSHLLQVQLAARRLRILRGNTSGGGCAAGKVHHVKAGVVHGL